MRKDRCWIVPALVGISILVIAPSCQRKPTPGQQSTTGAQVIDDDDYEHLPTLTAITPTPVEGVPTPSPGPTIPPATPTIPPPPEPNVSGTIYAGNTNPSPNMSVRLAFYDSFQLSSSDTPKNPEDFLFQLTFFPNPQVAFPINFVANLPTGDHYVGEAWQDTNQNGTIDAGDLIGDSERFYASEQMTSIEITLTTVN